MSSDSAYGSKAHRYLERSLIRKTRAAIKQFNMLAEGDRLLLAVSGGPDSLSLAAILSKTPEAVLGKITLHAIHVETGSPGTAGTASAIRSFLAGLGIKLTVIGPPSAGQMRPTQAKSRCYLCASRRRRCILKEAQRQQFSRIAMAHHRDDVIETLLMNIFLNREISTMLPCQSLFKGRFHIIRPLFYVPKKDLVTYARYVNAPVQPKPCPWSATSLRAKTRLWLKVISADQPLAVHNAFLALQHVKLGYLPWSPEEE